MGWFFFVFIIFLFDIEEKLNKVNKKLESFDNKLGDDKQKMLFNCLNKKVTIIVNNDEISFGFYLNTVGKILDYDSKWFIFQYFDKSTGNLINEYKDIKDLVSVEEVK